MQKGEKQKTVFQKLEDTYTRWEEFMSKSKIRMRKKLKKDKKEYYDFDYTRGQYYYSYPQNHPNFATPSQQKVFIKELLNEETRVYRDIFQDFAGIFFQTPTLAVQTETMPYQLQDFLRDFHQQLHSKIAALRIQKSLWLQNKGQQAVTQLMESEIRSYNHRYLRLNDMGFTFGKGLVDRLEDRTSTLKVKKFDEFHFSEIEKGDVVVALRMELVRQRCQFSIDRIKDELSLALPMKVANAQLRSYFKQAEEAKHIEQAEAALYLKRKAKLERHFYDHDPNFAQSEENLIQMEKFLRSLDYLRQSGGQGLKNALKSYKQLHYVPSNEQQCRMQLLSVCNFFFPKQMGEQLWKHKRQHLCYRLNYFASVMMRTLAQTNNYIIEIKDKDLLLLRNTMKRELETVFTNQVDSLFNLPHHEVVGLIDEGSYEHKAFPLAPLSQKALLFEEYFKQNKLVDGFTNSILNLMQIPNEKTIRQIVDHYVEQLIKNSSNRLKYLTLYYRNCHAGQKAHIINILNEKLLYGMFEQNLLFDKLAQILRVGETSPDAAVLKTGYLLLAINNVQLRKEVQSAINAQCSLMYKLKYRLELLEFHHKLPFEMSPQFLSRFSDQSNPNEPPREEKYPDPQNHDKIFRIRLEGEPQKIEVRRMQPDNPLFEGRQVLYRESKKQTQVFLQRIHNLCAFLIQRRENYLHEERFTGIVDRFRLINDLLRHQSNYQRSKLTYMQQLMEVFERTINPSGIYEFANRLYDCKQQQFYFDLSKQHYDQDYQAEAEKWQLQAQILKQLREKQTRSEDREKQTFRQELMRRSHNNSAPEISSIYYSDELPMEMDEQQINEEAGQESGSQLSDSQFIMNSSKLKSDYRSDFSVVSSEYHVKTTFKQILGRSSINAQAADQNRRQELMGKKQKKLINDSVLGGILKFENSPYYQHIHEVRRVLLKIQDLKQEYLPQSDPLTITQFYRQILTIVESTQDENIEGKQVMEENQLHRMLHDCSNAINRVVEKVRGGPSYAEHHLALGSQIITKLLNNTSGSEVNSIRGLYTALNALQIARIHYKYCLLGISTARSVRSKLQITFKDYSTQSLPRDGVWLGSTVIEQRDFPNNFKAIQQLEKLPQIFLFFGQYHEYYKLSMLTSHAALEYYKSSLLFFLSEVEEYEMIKGEVHSMQNYGCHFGSSFSKLSTLNNKVVLRRKLEFLHQQQNKVISSMLIREFLDFTKQKLASFREIGRGQGNGQVAVLEDCMRFEQFLGEVSQLAAELQISALKITSNRKELRELKKIQKICKVLPFVQNYLDIKGIDNHILRQTFPELYPVNQELNLKQRLTLEYYRPSFLALSRSLSSQVSQTLRTTIRERSMRKWGEFERNQIKTQRHYEHLQLTKWQEPFRLSSISALKDLFQFQEDLVKCIKVRRWLQCKIICFGSSLEPAELLGLRLVMIGGVDDFGIFWQDESSRLVRQADIVKMRFEDIDELSIIDKYTLRYITFQNLKAKYRQFLDNLSQLDIPNEGLQIYNIFFIGCPSLFKFHQRSSPSFLNDYCYSPPIKSETCRFMEYAISTNPNRYLRKHPLLSYDTLKAYAWEESCRARMKNKLYLLDDQCAVIKQTLNSSNRQMHSLTNEMAMQLYRGQRMRQFYNFLGIQPSLTAKQDYKQYLKKLQQNLLLGVDKLSPIQKYLSKFVQKIIKDKPELISIKDEIFEKIYESRFYEQLVTDQLMKLSERTLQKQLELGRLLLDSYQQKELMRQNKIIKATLNKVLVPKIVINPYFESPLLLQNYFFAGALKLSYVDNFLNRLKNRAIMVQLAEGGFGFLLKVVQLDQCVQSLCKALISFSEKEFSDRFRSFLQSHQQLQQRHRKMTIQNKNLKELVTVCREGWGKQLKSLLYHKLDSYLSTIHTRQKTYQSVFNMVRSLQVEVAKTVSTRYETRIAQLEKENHNLKEKFVEFKSMMKNSAKMSMEQSKDALYNSFKKQVDGILNKEVVQKYEDVGQTMYDDMVEQKTVMLLDKLRNQKIFYQLKLSTLQTKYREKSQDMNKLREEMTILQNTLTLQQFKNGKLTEEIKLLHEKNIEIEELKKEINRKDEQQVLNKFKLIKINENLSGKLARLEDKAKQDTTSSFIITKPPERTFAVQTNSEKKESRHFRIRTQTSMLPIQSNNKAQELPLWRQKWQNSQRKYQILMSKVIQIHENYRISRNTAKVIQKLAQVADECMANKHSHK